MARNTRSRSRPRATPDPAQGARDSAQKIWLAGLGAFERARTDGPRVFEALVEQGRNMGARAVGAADQALKAMREADYSGAGLQKLEKMVEARVSRSLERLGLVTREQADDLARQVGELSESLQAFARSSLRPGGAAPPRKRAASRKAAATRPARKRAKSGARKARAKAKRRAS
ncbi:MAG TPA: phasin family protein [Usitatibacter sp.]|nr:phasin family protein [Usitatibacter sp.]